MAADASRMGCASTLKLAHNKKRSAAAAVCARVRATHFVGSETTSAARKRTTDIVESSLLVALSQSGELSPPPAQESTTAGRCLCHSDERASCGSSSES